MKTEVNNSSRGSSHIPSTFKPSSSQVDDGWIQDGVTKDFPYPGAKYYLELYNPATTKYEYISPLIPPFSADTIRQKCGGGDFCIQARRDGRYLSKIEFSLALTEDEEEKESPTRSESPGNNNRRFNMSGADELDHALANAVRYKSICEILKDGGNGNGNGHSPIKIDDVLKQILLKQLDKNPIEELTKSFTQINGLKDLFKGGKRSESTAPYTLETAIAESLPEVIDLIKQKYAHKPAETSQPRNKEEKMNELFFVVQKLYEMAQQGESPDKGVALALSALKTADINKLIKATPERIIQKISFSVPYMKTFLRSEKGTKWITEFHRTLISAVSSSRAVSPAQNRKSKSSGNTSGADGQTRSSSDTPRTSSDSSGSGTRMRKPRQSGRGQKTIPGTPGSESKK